jgi:erythronate-4-phosphate dehydrogenase
MVRKIVIDQAIPYINPLFNSLAQVEAVSSDQMNASLLKDADALIVRSVTQVNQALLAGSRVGFVGTATIGTEHLDHAWLEKQGIYYASAPGCNAVAVVQYVMSAIAYWLKQRQQSLQNIRVGIVGVGQIGSRLLTTLQQLQVECELCDPPLAEQGKLNGSSSILELAERCDVITLHTPLTKEGKYPTYRMIDRLFFERLGNQKLLINAARGGLIDPSALFLWLKSGGQAIFDVWPDEPNIDRAVLEQVVLGTPHIAGYSIEGKRNASFQIYQQLAQFWEQSELYSLADLSMPKQKVFIADSAVQEDWFLSSYPINEDSNQLRQTYRESGQDGFKRLRNQYPFRRDFQGQEWIGNSSAMTLHRHLEIL